MKRVSFDSQAEFLRRARIRAQARCRRWWRRLFGSDPPGIFAGGVSRPLNPAQFNAGTGSQEGSAGEQGRYLFEHTVRLGCLLFLPEDYGKSPDQKWPLILYLHGIGERGDYLELVKIHGIPRIVEKNGNFPFVTLSPQCPDGTLWWDHNLTLKAMLDEVVSKYAIDPKRLYLTGNSMGGYGTWSLAMAYPDVFAAIVPICGGGMPEWVYLLKEVPVWAFHGAEDSAVPLERSQRMVDALRACGGDVAFTVYPGVGHDAWTATYDNPELYAWFLQHTR